MRLMILSRVLTVIHFHSQSNLLLLQNSAIKWLQAFIVLANIRQVIETIIQMLASFELVILE